MGPVLRVRGTSEDRCVGVSRVRAVGLYEAFSVVEKVVKPRQYWHVHRIHEDTGVGVCDRRR